MTGGTARGNHRGSAAVTRSLTVRAARSRTLDSLAACRRSEPASFPPRKGEPQSPTRRRAARPAGHPPRDWTLAGGAVELALAAGLVHPATHRTSARATALFLAAVFPATVKMAHDWRHRSTPAKALAYAGLPLQVPLNLWARKAAGTADR
ncbi:hypothetical protein GCM10010222_12340 [Streptomyces tanashiensis]|nr:hypothetical protein GCM10010222_12340 [Streptomyces tanashiensis]